MRFFKRKPKVYKEWLLASAFQQCYQMLVNDIETALPGKTIKVIEFGENDMGLRAIKYQIVDKINSPVSVLRGIAKLYEQKDPLLAEHLERIAGQVKGLNG